MFAWGRGERAGHLSRRAREWWKRTGKGVDGAGRGGLELAIVVVTVAII